MLVADRSADEQKLHKIHYRPDIDGLRAIAVLSVLFYHVGLTEFPGGFVGVDIFFVISGFLITTTILKDLERGTFSFLGFYNRRMRRIFPALFAMCLVWLVLLGAILPPQRFVSFGKELAAAAVFASNIFFEFQNVDAGGYFAKAANEQFLLHTWSLSVEEQFYVGLPILLVLLRSRSRATNLAAIVALALASFVFSVVAVRVSPLVGFYSALSRAFELLLGSLLAFGVPRVLLAGRHSAAFTLAGLALMAVAIFTYDTATPFPGAHALVPAVGAALVIGAGQGGDSAPKRFLSSPPLVTIGLFSYSLYLWHWPLVAVTRYLTVGHLSLVLRLAIIAASMSLAYLSLVFIERPFRARRTSLPSARVVATGCAASLVVAGLGGWIVLGAGLPGRFDAATQEKIAANERRAEEHFDGGCSNWLKDVRTIADIDFCKVGSGAAKRILFIGDSHVAQYFPLVDELYKQGLLQNRDALFAVAVGCLPALNLSHTGENFHCTAFTRLALQRAEAADVDLVVIGFAAWLTFDRGGLCRSAEDRCGTPLPPAAAEDVFLEDLQTIVARLKAAGKQVAIMLPAPNYSDSVPDIEMRRLALGRLNGLIAVQDRLHRFDFTPFRERLIALAASLGLRTFDPRATLCHDGGCTYAKDDVSLYSDDNHIATSQVGLFRTPMLQVLAR